MSPVRERGQEEFEADPSVSLYLSFSTLMTRRDLTWVSETNVSMRMGQAFFLGTKILRLSFFFLTIDIYTLLCYSFFGFIRGSWF